MDAAEKVLAHFGVKGMKWGVRKSRSKGTAPEHQSEMAQRKHEVLAKIKSHGIDAATNDDLKMLEQRVKLEMKFNELYPKKKTVIDHGSELAKRILLPVAEQQAKNYLNAQIGAKVLGPGTKVPTTKSPAATPSQVSSVLKVTGSHKLAEQPKTKLPHFGFA